MSTAPPAQAVRVLIADDTATVRLLLRRTLEASRAFTVIGEAADGAEAVDLADALQPDMVLLDLSMPVLDGLDAIPRIRRCAPSAQVVVLSGFAPDRMRTRAVEAGATAFLEKQQRPAELVASLLQTWKSGPRAAPVDPPPADCFRQAFDHASVALVLIDADGRILYPNAALSRLTGYGPDALAAATVGDLTHLEDREKSALARSAAAGGEVGTEAQDIRLVRADGRTVWASVGYSAISDSGLPRQLLIQLVDITERKRAERDLHRSNAELSRFAYLAAHELKLPLQALSGFAALLERVHGRQLDPQGRDFVGWILDGAKRMDALVEDLLAYCSVDTADPVLAPVSLDDVLADALGQLDREVVARGAIVGVGPLPVVAGDPVQLGQLLQNLLANALKFGPEGGPPQIQVAAERTADGWTVSVADNGIGVDEAARERIFRMFERQHPRERYEGTGIGLSICKRIIERRGGAIWVEPNPSGGSRFRFSIPDVLSVLSPLPAASTMSWERKQGDAVP